MIVVKRYQDSTLNLEALLPAPAAPAVQPGAAPLQPKQKAAAGEPLDRDCKEDISGPLCNKGRGPGSCRIGQHGCLIRSISGARISPRKKKQRARYHSPCRLIRKAQLRRAALSALNRSSAQLKVVTKNIPIMPAVPYFSDKVKIIVFDGSISSEGTLSAGYSKETGPKASYKGTASLNNFASVDKADAEDFLKWNSLYVDSMDVSYNPLAVKIGEVALSDFYSRIIINADGSINLQNIMERQSEKER